MTEFEEELLKKELDELNMKIFQLQKEICTERKIARNDIAKLAINLKILQFNTMRSYRDVLNLRAHLKVVDVKKNA